MVLFVLLFFHLGVCYWDTPDTSHPKQLAPDIGLHLLNLIDLRLRAD